MGAREQDAEQQAVTAAGHAAWLLANRVAHCFLHTSVT